MKKNLLTLIILSAALYANAQSCAEVQGLSPVTLRFGTNAYGYPESNLPTVPLYWNRFYKLDELTGNLVPQTCSYTGDPNLHEFAACACFLTGTYFRKVTDACDATPCGGDVNLPQLPRTNNSNSSSSWSQSATWISNQVPDVSSALSILVTKSTLFDADLSFSEGHWLILSSGNSHIISGNTVTTNSVIQLYDAAQLENFGTLKGYGQVMGSLINSGTLSPGNSPGKFTITGNYTANSTAVHQIEIASSNLYDTISIVKDISCSSGNAILNGTLNVSLLYGFMPALGDVYKIITFSSATGTFTSHNLPSLPTGLIWEIKYNPTDVTLQVNAVVLPLTFTSVKVYQKDNGAQVDWYTENEVNVKKYEVEKSTDGIYFKLAGSVNAKVSGAGTNSYGWFDFSPQNGDNYYRIKAIDIDG